MREKNIISEEEFLKEDNEGQLAIDVYQTEEAIVIESTVAGVDPDDIDIDISSDSITIRGERKKVSEISEDNYLYQECYWGKFSRSVILPQEVDPDEAVAEFKQGVLKVVLPKLNKGKSRKIKIKS